MIASIAPSNRPLNAFAAMQYADAKYDSAIGSVTSQLELPWAIHAGNAIEDLQAGIAALQPFTQERSFTGAAFRSSVDFAGKAVKMIEGTIGNQLHGNFASREEIVGAINSAKAALVQEG